MKLKDNPELVERFRVGDRETLAALYQEHVEAAEDLLRRGFSFKSKDQAIRFRGFREPFELQEVLQDGFIRAFRKSSREAYDGAKPFRPYLITIFRNLVIDRYRKKQTEQSYFVTIGRLAAEDESPDQAIERLSAGREVEVGQPGFSPELEAMRTQISSVLQTFVAELDELDRRILTEHLMGSRTQTEMADELGISRNDLRKQVRLMREALLRHLKKEGVIENLDVAEVFTALLVVLLIER